MKNIIPSLREVSLLLLACTPVQAEVKTNTINGKDFHHILLTLSQQDMLPNPEGRSDELAYTLADGGMFEIFVPSDSMPGVEAPECDVIILRMPWTSPEVDQEFVAEKSRLLDDILKVREGTSDAISVAVELDPYLDTSNGAFTLTRCNAFFRNAFGRYIPNTDPLNK